jgi:hypothetical protein
MHRLSLGRWLAVLFVAALWVPTPSSAQVCGRGSTDITISGTQVLNTFHPSPIPMTGTTTVTAGATSIPVDAARSGGGAPIAAGDLVLVIQMQGVQIDRREQGTTGGRYGDGAGGADRRGATAGATFVAGRYELARAAGPVAAGALPLRGALANTYTSSNAITAGGNVGTGFQRYQVVRIVEARDLTVPVGATLTTLPWDGRSGGVLAVDVTRNLVINGTFDTTGMGFRGGSPVIPPGMIGTETDTTQACFKGEGVAGPVARMYSRLAGVVTGATGLYGGDSERGGPGNAGGCPVAGDSGGGGGGGGRAGGVGSVGAGASVDPDIARPGEGYSDPTRLLLGGGGGSGSLDDPALLAAVSGQAGGGIVYVRAVSISGTGSIRADGDDGGVQAQEGGGGGGGGGAIFLYTDSASFASLTLRAQGGDGSDTMQGDDGGGGGGGGGFVLVATPTGMATVTIDVTGGAAGTGTTADDTAVGGTGGFQQISAPPLTSPCPAECVTGADCADGNVCTTDTCTMGRCTNPAVAAGSMGGCAAGRVCSGAPTNMCVECVTNAQCGGATPVCDTASNVCVQCLSDTNCSGATPVCNTTTRLCVQCTSNAQCGGATPFCDGATSTCRGCIAASECADANACTTDTCTAGVCSNPAVAAGMMGSCAAGLVCSGAPTNLCVQCVTNAQCSGATPVCNTGTGMCMAGCLADADCNDGNECTSDRCVSTMCMRTTIAAGTACAGGVCNGTSPAMCVPCVDDAMGTGTDSGCSMGAPLCLSSGGSSRCQPCSDTTMGGLDLGCTAAAPACLSSGGASACVPCEDSASGGMRDNGCTAGAPICATSGTGTRSCVECTDDTHCAMGTICGPASTCVPGCTDDADCAGTPATPICDTGARVCVGCFTDADCDGTETCSPTRRVCEQGDSDGDGVADDVDLDDDNDGIPDATELPAGLADDADDDGILDFQDPSAVTCTAGASGTCTELPESVDFDRDGIANHLDLDADGDGLLDVIEGGGEPAMDGTLLGFADLNGNGLGDTVEASPLPVPNTDMAEGPDFLDLDADGDFGPDALEGFDADHDGIADFGPRGTDTDGDGLDDAFDLDCTTPADCGGTIGASAPVPDTDADGDADFQDVDDDGDGMRTATERDDADAYTGPAADESDVDDDGRPNWLDTDSDADGADDRVESGGDRDNDDNGILDYLDPSFAPRDLDMDGVPDVDECPAPASPGAGDCPDSDMDGSPDYDDVDDDGDGIPTRREEMVGPDTDGDGVPNRLDLDSDDDGITDLREQGGADADANNDGRIDDPTDADMDGIDARFDRDDSDPMHAFVSTVGLDTDRDGEIDATDLDADDDGLFDVIEGGGTDADGDGRVDGATDANDNGIRDSVDRSAGGTALPVPDTDGDDASDFQDVDDDGDSILTRHEAPDADGDHAPDDAQDSDTDGTPDYLDVDDDGDGVHTRFEAPDPNGDRSPMDARDSDTDGTPDYLDVDDDGDDIDTNDEAPDANGDGDPADARDTDGDGTPDYLDPNGGLTTGGFAGGACGCRTQTGSSSGTPLLVALGLLLAITRRRARRR